MTGVGATPSVRTPLPEEPRTSQRPGKAAAEPAASPLWPLVLLLGEIATRVEREQAAGPALTPRTDEPASGAG